MDQVPSPAGLERPAPPRSPVERVRDWVTWFGPARLVATALSLVAIAAAAFWLLRAPAPPVEDHLPRAPGGTATTPVPSSTAASATSTTAPTELVVHVAGAVVAPGVLRLDPGARVVDAVDAAGGLAPDAASDLVNLAAAVHDGDRVYVPRVGEDAAPPVLTGTTSTAATGDAGIGPVPLNTATVDQFEELPGVGPAIASAIVAYRDEHGPFLDVEQLTDVPGIGPAKLETLRGLVTV